MQKKLLALKYTDIRYILAPKIEQSASIEDKIAQAMMGFAGTMCVRRYNNKQRRWSKTFRLALFMNIIEKAQTLISRLETGTRNLIINFPVPQVARGAVYPCIRHHCYWKGRKWKGVTRLHTTKHRLNIFSQTHMVRLQHQHMLNTDIGSSEHFWHYRILMFKTSNDAFRHHTRDLIWS